MHLSRSTRPGFGWVLGYFQRCCGCGVEAELPRRSTLPTRRIRLTQRGGDEPALPACSWACAAQIAEVRARVETARKG